jgi:peptidoglycan hydrolase-like protein with peptidoglycan-binding domain
VPTTDLSNPDPWIASKRRSRARRAELARSLRRLRGRRSAVAVLGASLALAGGAMAHSTSSSSSGAGSASSVRGSGVTALQAALGIPADGVYGPQTRRAVRAFQRSHGLVVDGIAGPQTLGALGLTTGTAQQSSSSASASAGSGSGSVLQRIAQCESGGDPGAVSSDGRYRGKYQFSRATWRAMGGSGDPAAAPESVQDGMAAKLLAARGTSPWPNCG